MSLSQQSPYLYRPMTAADIEAAHGLSVRLKWPHRLEDWTMLQRTAQGFVVEDNGVLIGSAFACHQGAFSSIGLVIVSDEYQGKGIGRQLMGLALEAATPRTPILNATLAGAPLYASMGFVEFGQIQQHQGLALEPTLEPLASGEICRGLTDSDHAALLKLAKAGSGLDRRDVLEYLLPEAEHGVGIEHDGKLQGFALLRPFGRGRAIGPVVAQNTRQAEQLIARLLATIPGEFVRIDIPADCGLAPWLESVGLKQVDRVAQMARGPAPMPSDGVQQFALVTQAIG